MSDEFRHIPVMAAEVQSFFANCTGKLLVDATAGGGGHLAILAAIAGELGEVYGFDRDMRAHKEDAAAHVVKKYPQAKLVHAPFSQVAHTLRSRGHYQIDGLLCDLGVSSHQFDDARRGFSLKHDGPLDMRMDQSVGETAYDWLKTRSEREIADTLYMFGQEKRSRQIAELIKKSWPIENSTLAFANLVCRAARAKGWRKTHPATKTFQAIRIAVNGELAELTALLDSLTEILAIGGRAVFISFHSLEDGLVKRKFKELASGKKFVVLTKKPLVASASEVHANPRARSAKLRVIERVAL